MKVKTGYFNQGSGFINYMSRVKMTSAGTTICNVMKRQSEGMEKKWRGEKGGDEFWYMFMPGGCLDRAIRWLIIWN